MSSTNRTLGRNIPAKRTTIRLLFFKSTSVNLPIRRNVNTGTSASLYPSGCAKRSFLFSFFIFFLQFADFFLLDVFAAIAV